ncbi:rhomboid family intramembrane serine protease [Weeksella virosa]|uniref:rhomboid family intramembrane serine protease n=1 Tax=Weeksella virosa TaxID=1014 RepID=UPI002552BC51|nr:rhomboid family intramembrane serine protease [Weeksella virosa]MDK7675473.1 rhomboid family intramembrane serine protease [Weeksella virosa]
MLNRIPVITKNILIINVLFFLAKYIFASKGLDLDMVFGAFYPESPNFRFWQVLSHMFMHADFTHILFNMFGLWMFGSVVEQTIGAKKYLAMYLLAGFCGFALFNLSTYFQLTEVKDSLSMIDLDLIKRSAYEAGQGIMHSNGTNEEIVHIKNQELNTLESKLNNIQLTKSIADNIVHLFSAYTTAMVGASGAIYGLLVAFAVLYPEAKLMMIFLPIPIKAKYFIPILIVLEFYMGIANYSWNPVAHFAHLGGALVGYLYIRNWKKNQFRRW